MLRENFDNLPPLKTLYTNTPQIDLVFGKTSHVAGTALSRMVIALLSILIGGWDDEKNRSERGFADDRSLRVFV